MDVQQNGKRREKINEKIKSEEISKKVRRLKLYKYIIRRPEDK